MPTPSQAFRRILVPTDGSPASRAAVALAIALAKEHESEVLFCYAIDLGTIVAQTTTPYTVTDPTPMIDAANEGAEAILGEASLLAAAAQLRSAVVKFDGRPIPEILRYAAEQNADAIVMGTQGKRGIARFFLGSTAEGVLRGANVPVFVVHGEMPTKGSMFGRILVAVDDSDPGDAAADYAIGLALGERADLVLCNVVETPKFVTNLEEFGIDTRDFIEDWTRDAKRLLRHVAGRAKAAGVRRVDEALVSGEPVDEILRAAGERHADLIAIGTHGRRGLRRMFLGSIAEGVVRRSPIPVVVVRSYDPKLKTTEKSAERVLANV
jgi:nucleotide-binding universal stress UspA family protein